MNAVASTPARGEDAEDASEYAELMAALDSAIDEAKRKVESGRVYDAENERVRIKWIRCLAYTVDVRRKVTTDRDLEELSERIDALEEQRGLDL